MFIGIALTENMKMIDEWKALRIDKYLTVIFIQRKKRRENVHAG